MKAFQNTLFRQVQKGCNCSGDKNETWEYKEHRIIIPPIVDYYFYHKHKRVQEPRQRKLTTLKQLIDEIIAQD